MSAYPRTIKSADLATWREKFVTVTQGGSGHFAVTMWWNPDLDGFWEPWDTGFGRYPNEDEARVEAISLAEMEGHPYLLPDPAPATEEQR